jgi:PAS domain S-box-containing protein
LIERLSTLPPRSVVLLVSLAADGENRPYRAVSVIGRLTAASTAPIYTWSGNFLGSGVFGGRFLLADRAAEGTAQIALRVLGGERAEEIPITTLENVDALDWRQFDRWGVREARVPSGIEVRFREPSVFDRYRGYILGALAILLLQGALIAGLLVQRRNRRLAESSLRESEERFRVMADTAPVMIWRSGPDQQRDFFNARWLEFTGRSLADEMGEGWTEGVHREDIDHCLAVYTTAFVGREPFRLDYRLRRADGTLRWVIDTGVPRTAPGGGFLGYIGSALDITERRQAEEALRQSHAEIQDLAGRLITAQEAERARIARDLHDDVSQRLAGLSISLSACKRRPEMLDYPALVEVLNAIQRNTVEVAEDIRLLSHDLHPGVLEHTGLAVAVRSHCREFAQRHLFEVIVDADVDLAVSDMATALCLYRIVQEALSNIAKHAEAREVHITLHRVHSEVQLTVGDDGKGFDLSTARRQGSGLGLRSIDERVRQLGGRLSIETSPSHGTLIEVWLNAMDRPLPSMPVLDHAIDAVTRS